MSQNNLPPAVRTAIRNFKLPSNLSVDELLQLQINHGLKLSPGPIDIDALHAKLKEAVQEQGIKEIRANTKYAIVTNFEGRFDPLYKLRQMVKLCGR